MADEFLRSAALGTEQLLHDRGLGNLHVRVYGNHLILYSGDPSDREQRVRLTELRRDHYRLDIAGRGGRWESTPFIGSRDELFAQLTDQFAFLLAPW